VGGCRSAGPMPDRILRKPRHDLDDSPLEGSEEIQLPTGAELFGLCVVFIPLALWLALCLFGEQGLINWCKYGRKRTSQSYVQNRMR
jgi:hypothetical protein